MIYFLETEIPNNKKINKSLKSVYGLGKKQSNIICKKLGIIKTTKTLNLSNKHINKMSQYVLDSNLLITNNLKKEKALIFQQLINIKSVRGLRKLKGLPVRGQRTHTNAKTAKKIFFHEINIQIK